MKNNKNQTQTINTLEDAIGYLSNSVNQVSYDVSSINFQVDDVQNQVNDMKNNVQSLENEIRTFMNEMKQSALINDAKQNIVMIQMEYDKKYKHREEVRRRLIGLLQSVDDNIIKRSTMETIGEETIVNNPDYWLSHALIALCYWYCDKKELAEVSLQKALNKSEEKTSFLFFLIHLRANRINTAIKWLKKYLILQDPTNMDCMIVLLMDALCSGVFSNNIVDVIIQQVEKWKHKLNGYQQYENKQISTWKQYFEKKISLSDNIYNYINEFVIEKNIIHDITNFSSSHNKMTTEFQNKLNGKYNTENNKYQNKIDNLLNILIFDYDKEELELKNIMNQNNLIINQPSKNNINEYKEQYNKTDFYTHLSNMCINEEMFDIEINTRKLAISMSKEYIIKGYQNLCDSKGNKNIDINISIGNWLGKTNNGSNEFELKKELCDHIQNKHKTELEQIHVITKNMIGSIIISIIVMVFTKDYIFITIPLFIIVILFNIYYYNKNYKIKQLKQEKIKQEQQDMNKLLMNTIAEIVDYYFECEGFQEEKEEFIKYLNSLDYKTYIKTHKENQRNIIIGDMK